MSWINLITNLIGLLLWLNWISIRYSTLAQPTGVSLAGTIRKADNSRNRQWGSLLMMAGIILLRGFVYYMAQSRMKLDLGILAIWFAAVPGYHSFLGMLLFSALSMLVCICGLYAWFALLSIINFQSPDEDLIQKMVRRYFSWLEPLPRMLKFLLPLVGGIIFWMLAQPLLAWNGIVPHVHGFLQLFLQSLIVGGSSYLLWKHLVAGVLLLHLLNSYLYLGKHPFWNFINTTARNLLLPFSWIPLRAGKVDFLPLAAIAVVFLVGELIIRLPLRNFRWLPF